MKHIKWYALTIAFIIYTAGLIYLGTKLNKPPIDTTAIEQANTRVLEAENRVALLEEGIEIYKAGWAKAERLLKEQFDSYYQNPNITDIPQVGEYIHFLPDSTEFKPEFFVDKRKAKLLYPFRSEYFSADYTIIYDYYSTSFDITPKNLEYKIQKKLPFCASAIISSNGLGALLQAKVWRINVGAGGIVNREIEGVALVTLGFNF